MYLAAVIPQNCVLCFTPYTVFSKLHPKRPEVKVSSVSNTCEKVFSVDSFQIFSNFSI